VFSLVACEGIGPHMHYWPSLSLKYIEEGESNFSFVHSYHTCVRDVSRSELVFILIR
jgi:hypothetical protein